MSFVGFIYHNHQVRTASATIGENLNELFDVATSVPEETARSGDVRQVKEETFTQNIMDAFKGLEGIVVVDEARLKYGLDLLNLVASPTGESALNRKFMNSCLAFDTVYLQAGESKDIYAAFTQRQGNDLKLTMVSLDALEKANASDLDIPQDDVVAAIQAAPQYIRDLKGQIYSEAVTASFTKQAAHALKNKAYAYANQCQLRVIATDRTTGKPVVVMNKTVNRGHFAGAQERNSYVQSLHLGATT